MRKVVLFGMMSHKPVAGIAHLTMPYVVGLERLGYEAYYVETHGAWPIQLQRPGDLGDGSIDAAAYIERVVRYFGFWGRWAYHARHSDGGCYGMSERELRKLFETADLFLNLHAGTLPPEELADDDRLVLIDTDPVGLQIDASQDLREGLDLLDAHSVLFSWGENLGKEGCGVPIPAGYHFRATRVPVLLDLWRFAEAAPRHVFTTIGNWQQGRSDRIFGGELYSWSKHHEFLKFLDLPTRTGQRFELALASYDDEVQQMLEKRGWRVRPAAEISYDLDLYRRYIADSLGEFTVAKDQNVRLRSGWFSDRSATYLASGRPVITQETGFSNSLPTGEGLFAFSTMDEILAALEELNSDYERHSAAAREIACEYFDAERVLSRMLAEVGLEPRSLSVVPVSRRPTRLARETVEAVLSRPVPRGPEPAPEPEASIIVVTFDGLPFTRLCLESVLAHTETPPFELIVVDNGSGDGTRAYLERLATRDPRVRLVLGNDGNRGFPAAVNQGLAEARADLLVVLNNDAIVAPGWLAGLARHLSDAGLGAVGPVTNRIGTESEVEVDYTTYGEFLDAARERLRRSAGRLVDVRMLAMFCLALRRETLERVGPLDEGFQVGMVEDDDYSERLRRAGYRLGCAEDVLVHHFGEASFGKLFADGRRDELMRLNARRFEEKWGTCLERESRPSPTYRQLVMRVRKRASSTLPPGKHVLVVSRGDEELLALGGCHGAHFPQLDDGCYAGHYPADSAEAIDHLERVRQAGAEYLLFPQTSFWWLDHYVAFAAHLRKRYAEVARDDDCLIFALADSE